MTEKNYPHLKFLDENREELDKLQLPVLLQQRLDAFNDLHADLDNMSPEHLQSMETALEALSHELMEDLEDELAELIEHNALPGISAEPELPGEDQEPVPAEQRDMKEIDEQSEGQEILPAPENQGKVNDTLPNDVRIIKKLLDSGWKRVSRANLVRQGFQGDTGLTTIVVGPYLLHRYRYEVHFSITNHKV